MRRYVFRLAILTLAVLGSGTARADDQQIAQQIIERLQAEKKAGSLKGFSIDLQVDEGTVWLTGRVASEQQQARALDLARRVGGVKQVVNDLSIAAPPSKTAVAARQAPPPALPPAPTYVEPTPVPTQQIVVAPRQAPPTYVEPSPAPAQQMVVATPQPLPTATAIPTYEPAPAMAAPAPAAPVQVAAQPQPQSQSIQRHNSSPANSSMLNSVSKALVSAVHGGRQPDEQPAGKVQFASGNQEVAKAASPAAIGSGVDANASTRRTVVQAAQPVANLPQQAGSADSLQAIPAYAPQMVPQMAMMPMQMPMQMPYPYMMPVYAGSHMQVPLAMGPARAVNYNYAGGPMPMGGPVPMGGMGGGMGGGPMPISMPGSGVGIAPARYDHPQMPGYAWPSYAAHPNYAAVTYPKQYSPTAWPYIGPFYPYPQVPLGWRKVTMEWDDGWWVLDFKDRRTMYNNK